MYGRVSHSVVRRYYGFRFHDRVLSGTRVGDEDERHHARMVLGPYFRLPLAIG